MEQHSTTLAIAACRAVMQEFEAYRATWAQNAPRNPPVTETDAVRMCREAIEAYERDL